MNRKSKSIYWIVFAVILLVPKANFAQDQHFSQFFAAPLSLNPALAGSYDGSFRVGIIYRDQWRAVVDNSISTYALGGDLRYPLNFTSKKNPDYISIGFQFFGDQAALYDLNTNQLSIFSAYHKALDLRTKQYLSLGFMIGIAQRNINYEDLIFADQFNNLDAFDLESSENLPTNNFAYGDFALGLHYTISPSKYFNMNTGFSMFHFHTPNISFYRDNTDINSSVDVVNNLPIKYSAYFNTTFSLNTSLKLSPRALVLVQGPHQELNIGASVRIGRDQFYKQGVHLGAFLRPVRDQSNYALDALVVLAGFEYNSMLIGMSYDLNLRDLVTDQQGIGVFELSLSYIGEYENEFSFCPKF